MERFCLEDPTPTFVRLTGQIADAIDRMGELGRATASARQAGYRPWDPEVLRADLVGEEILMTHLQGLPEPVTLLSEEAGRVVFASPQARNTANGCRRGPGEPSEPLFLVMDPFDGSLLYRRDLRLLWAVGLGLWRGDRHVATCVRDLLGRRVWTADKSGIFEQGPGGALSPVSPLRNRPTPDRLDRAYVATYLMKPHYLRRSLPAFGSVLERAQFVVPIGGPLAWAFLASGRLDAYLPHSQPLTEVYSGIGLALAAGCVVTDLQGNPPQLVDDVNQRYTLVAASNRRLHAQILEEVNRKGRNAVEEPDASRRPGAPCPVHSYAGPENST